MAAELSQNFTVSAVLGLVVWGVVRDPERRSLRASPAQIGKTSQGFNVYSLGHPITHPGIFL